jgi:hypothetical protein
LAVYFFSSEIDTANGFLASSLFKYSDECLFQPLIPRLTPVSLMKTEWGFDIVTQLADTGKRPSYHL